MRPRVGATLREIVRDPMRTLIMIDPRLTEIAELADITTSSERVGKAMALMRTKPADLRSA